ncbi:MAG: hypothetical protein U1F30_05005 [Steroidobacteraceae bacterium]
MPAAPAFALALAALGLALGAALLFGTTLALPWRLGALGLLVAALAPPLAELAGRGGRRRLGRDSSGRWWLGEGAGRPDYVQPRGRALLLGPWIWLRLRGPSGTRYVFIDGRRAEPGAFRLLKLTLRLDPERPGGLASDRDRPNC